MKRNVFLLAGVALMSLFACADNDEFSENAVERVNTYLKLEIVSADRPSTRTQPNADTDIGTPGEQKITNLMVLVCDDQGVVKKTYETSSMLSTPGGAETIEFPMNTGNYQVYVIANYSPNEALWASLPGLDVRTQTIDNVTLAMMRQHYALDHHFIMFNECNGKDMTAGAPVSITPANVSRNPALCKVRLDRLAVKIVSTPSAPDITQLKAPLSADFANVAVEAKGFKLLNGATRTHLQQQWTNDRDAVYPYVNTLVTPWLVSDSDPAIFSFYNKYSDFRTVTYDAGGDYLMVQDNYRKMPFYDSADGPIFCMENNPTWNGTGVVDAMKGNTTGLVYQYLMKFDGSDEKAGTNCFYAYGGRFFPSLKALQTAYTDALNDASPSLDDGEDLAAAERELRAAYDSPEPEAAISDFRAKYRIKVYMDGLMYYIFYIKEPNYLEGESAYYSVMRNTIYSLNVEHLLRIGDDIPGGWNPDTRPVDPVDPTNTYMKVAVTVNPWVMNQENIDLK